MVSYLFIGVSLMQRQGEQRRHQSCKLIAWDEAPQLSHRSVPVVDNILCDIMDTIKAAVQRLSFGGKASATE